MSIFTILLMLANTVVLFVFLYITGKLAKERNAYREELETTTFCLEANRDVLTAFMADYRQLYNEWYQYMWHDPFTTIEERDWLRYREFDGYLKAMDQLYPQERVLV